ncbi:MAG: hypothetical protein U0354_16695 [Candidatus Sericytochromatia bacterium]
MNNFDNVTPKKIGNFNVPKNVIECKVDTLTFLEILLRKNICTWEEIEEIREVVVMHLNVIFPELQLSYSTPAPLKDQAPLTPPEQPQKPLYYTPSPTEFETVNNSEPEKQEQPQTPQQATQSTGTNPLYHTNQPKILSANKPNPSAGIKPINNNPVQAPQAGANNPNPAPKPLIPNAGPPKILNAPPRKKI